MHCFLSVALSCSRSLFYARCSSKYTCQVSWSEVSLSPLLVCHLCYFYMPLLRLCLDMVYCTLFSDLWAASCSITRRWTSFVIHCFLFGNYYTGAFVDCKSLNLVTDGEECSWYIFLWVCLNCVLLALPSRVCTTSHFYSVFKGSSTQNVLTATIITPCVYYSKKEFSRLHSAAPNGDLIPNFQKKMRQSDFTGAW